jgi:UDP-glucose 6-dehydrogenase
MESCMPKDTSCLINALENVSDHITVNGNKGFKDRVLQNTNKIYEYMNGEWVLQN